MDNIKPKKTGIPLIDDMIDEQEKMAPKVKPNNATHEETVAALKDAKQDLDKRLGNLNIKKHYDVAIPVMDDMDGELD
jgi:hypothetical protein